MRGGLLVRHERRARSRGRDAVAALAATALLATAAGCGGDDEPGELTVSAAASLKEALTKCTSGRDDPKVRLQFAGSDELAAQIRKGVKPDVFAAANTKLPAQLAQEGLLEQPVTFATNVLVVATPRNSEIRTIEDLARDGVKVAVGSEGVPIGDYTREVISRLGGDEAQQILGNVRTEEPDVKGIVGKVSQGAVDAGFVYRTDVAAADLREVPLPEDLQPQVEYGAGVVKESEAKDDAQAFLDGLTDGPCADALREARFGAAPAGA